MSKSKKNNLENMSKYKGVVENLKDLIFSKRINFLLGAGASMPAIQCLNQNEVNQEKNFEEIILNVKEVSDKIMKCNFLEKNVELTFNNYNHFISNIIKILENSNSRETPRSVNIFTTNYDIFIEKVIDNHLYNSNFIFNDGANGYFIRKLDSGNFNRVTGFKGLNDNYINEIPVINLIKPHGSINWEKVCIKEEEEIQIKLNIIDNFSKGVVVKPNKLESQEVFLNNHFHEMLRVFQYELDKSQSVLFVLGFSFQDKHIKKMLKRAIQNRELQIYIFCYNKDDKRKILLNLQMLENNLPKNLKIFTSSDIFNSSNQKLFTLANLAEVLSIINLESDNYDK
ncbi:SIR2 family protein [Spiroplasma endosymbiont of Cantharis nigra]|uniref:SIR2 family protein n=1 Tax=Spiroplasma endosymbiont of Cantharis nigra TaxID=3066278 RepID=UPI0030D004E5